MGKISDIYTSYKRSLDKSQQDYEESIKKRAINAEKLYKDLFKNLTFNYGKSFKSTESVRQVTEKSWDDRTNKTTIGAKGNEAMFHLAFSQQLLTKNQERQIVPHYCSIAKDKVKIRTWIGSLKALNPEYADQDGLCQGEFRVHVEVVTEYGHRAHSDFIITVGNDWNSLDARKLDCHCIRESLRHRIWNRIKHR
jgi:hypothetical protein